MLWITRSHVHVERGARPWLILRYPEDDESLLHQFEVYDALYASCRLDAARGG